jgi:hypothetical protein
LQNIMGTYKVPIPIEEAEMVMLKDVAAGLVLVTFVACALALPAVAQALLA